MFKDSLAAESNSSEHHNKGLQEGLATFLVLGLGVGRVLGF